MKLRSPQLAVISIVFVFVGIFITMLAGWWQSESSKVPATYTSGEYAGEYNPADIRGSYSFDDISSAFEVPIDVLVQAFGFEEYENPAEMRVKTFEDIYGVIDGKEIGTDSMRFFVALYLSRPYTPEVDTGLPRRAIEFLVGEEKITEEEAAEYRKKYAVDISGAIPEDGEAVIESSEESEEDTTIKGKTTFRDLVEWGLTREEIEVIIDMEPGPPTQSLRDYFMEKGKPFSEIKDELQELVDKRVGTEAAE